MYDFRKSSYLISTIIAYMTSYLTYTNRQTVFPIFCLFAVILRVPTELQLLNDSTFASFGIRTNDSRHRFHFNNWLTPSNYTTLFVHIVSTASGRPTTHRSRSLPHLWIFQRKWARASIQLLWSTVVITFVHQSIGALGRIILPLSMCEKKKTWKIA